MLARDSWISGLFGIVTGIMLSIGFMTPLAGMLIALGAVGIALSGFPALAHNPQDARLSTVLSVTIATAIAFLGPGAFSVDARMFGRREIVIPRKG